MAGMADKRGGSPWPYQRDARPSLPGSALDVHAYGPDSDCILKAGAECFPV